MVPLLLGVLVTTQHYKATQQLDDTKSSIIQKSSQIKDLFQK